jgi:hypothetical protein
VVSPLPPIHFGRMREQIQIGNHDYAAHLAHTEPGLLAGVVCGCGEDGHLLDATVLCPRARARLTDHESQASVLARWSAPR